MIRKVRTVETGWKVVYMDLVTLMLALMVVMIGHGGIGEEVDMETQGQTGTKGRSAAWSASAESTAAAGHTWRHPCPVFVNRCWPPVSGT